MDVGQASASIDALIDKRAAGRAEATDAEMMWKASVRKHNEKIRRKHAAEWFRYWSALADSLRASADAFDARAERLLEAEEGGGDAP